MITLEEIRPRGNFKAADESLIESVIEATVDLWENETRRLWCYRQEHVEEHYLEPKRRGAKLFWPRLGPIEEITVEEWDTDETETDAETLVEGDDYDLVPVDDYAHRIVRKRSSNWLTYLRFTVTGGVRPEKQVCGTNLTPVTPPRIREALIVQSLFTLQRLQGDRIVQRTVALGDAQTSFLAADVHPVFARAARYHRRRSYGGYG